MGADAGTLLEPLSCGLNGMRGIPFETMDHVVVIGAGIIGTLNGLIAKARGAKRVSLFNRSRGRLDVIGRLGLPIDDLVDMSVSDPEAWISRETARRGVDAVIVSASVKCLGSRGLGWLARGGHLSLFAGMPKSDAVEPLDLNLIHYRELHVHGANSSVRRDYLEALDMLASGAIDGNRLITHRFPLKDFAQAVKTQSDPGSGALKVVILP
jgi:L-iditol 2-dehydrogenase